MAKTSLDKIIILITTLLVIYFSRWTFFYKFDPVYWENFYYESQWNIPNSRRVISDGGVSRFVGYKLVNGENPFDIDYWVPPAGKYIYGLSAKFLNNPYFASLGFYFSLISVTLLLSTFLFKKRFEITVATLLVATNPLITDQITRTMLDLPQALFLTTHIFFLFKFSKQKKLKNLLLSSVFLGLALGTKIGYFVPTVAIIDTLYLIKNKTKPKNFLLFGIFILSGYVLAYFCYFIRHPNPFPWIRLHQKIIDFWSGTPLLPSPYNFFTFIFSNKFFQILGNERVWMDSSVWSIIFPTSFISLIYNLTKKQKGTNINYLTYFSFAWIILLTLIDFWPRYLVSLIPILILLLVNNLKNKKWLLGIILLLNLIGLKNHIFPNPIKTLKQISQDINTSCYKEIYQFSLKNKFDQNQFLSFWQNLNIEQSQFTGWQKQDNQVVGNYNINNQNQLKITLSKINNQWKISNYSLID